LDTGTVQRGTPSEVSLSRDAGPIWEVIPGVDGVAWAPHMKASRRRDSRLRRTLAVGDVLACALALCVAIYLVPGSSTRLRLTDVLLVPLVVVLSKAIGLYDRDQHRLHKSTLDEMPWICNMAVFFALGVWLAEAVFVNGSLDRSQVFVLVLAGFLAIAGVRAIVRTLLVRLVPAERVLLVGSGRECDRATKALGSERGGHSAAVVGRIAIDAQGPKDYDRRDLPEILQTLAGAIRALSVERVVFALDGFDQDEMLDLIRLIKALGVKLSVVPRLLEVVGSASAFDDVQGMSLLGVRPYGLSKSSRELKRAMDVIVATATLIVLAPVFALIAAAIKLDSPGPIFFRQRRIGRKGRYFEMIKFRSMVSDAESLKPDLRARNEVEGGLFKITDDPRITHVGRLLRRTSLDELPQLLNVLRGDMSLVGPRPLIPDEDALIAGWQRRRLVVKPGMTGLWQIFGSSRIPMQDMVKIDYLYGANWSLWLDLKILLRTVPYVLGRRGV
jgi:exopolysaccharide biosynthesis polyprenyl glycosylphosphotransferase